MVHLTPVTRDNWREGIHVRAAADQQRFVADHEPVALLILAKAFVRVGGLDWRPLLIQSEATTVGVVAVVDDRDRHGELAVFHLLIDRDQQRRGYGRAALQSLINLGMRTKRCDRLRLTVHPENCAAIALYQSEGFGTDGANADGELDMSLSTPDQRYDLRRLCGS